MRYVLIDDETHVALDKSGELAENTEQIAYYVLNDAIKRAIQFEYCYIVKGTFYENIYYTGHIGKCM